MKQVNFVAIPCICGGTDTTTLGEKDGLLVGHCTQCGILRTPYTFANYAEYYTEGDTYHVERHGQTPYRERFEHDRKVARQRIARFMQVTRPRWLDVGCANGAFVNEVHGFYDAEGLEINPRMARWALEQTSRPVHTDWGTVEGLFNVISLHDVLEHAPNPLALLVTVREHLLPGGHVIVDVPDGGATVFQENPMQSHHMKPLEHLWFFRRSDLERLFHQAGLLVQAADAPIPGKLVMYGVRA